MTTKELALRLLNIKGKKYVYVVDVSDDPFDPDIRDIEVEWVELVELIQGLLDTKFKDLKENNE